MKSERILGTWFLLIVGVVVVVVGELLGSLGMTLSLISDSFFFFLPNSVVDFFCGKLQEN